MGTSDPSRPTESRRRHEHSSAASSSRQAAVEDNPESKSVGVRKRSTTIQSGNNPKEMPGHSRDVVHSKEEAENLIAAFHLGLADRNQEIDQHHVEYSKLKHKNGKLQVTIQEQDNKYQEQGKSIQELEKIIQKQIKTIHKQNQTILKQDETIAEQQSSVDFNNVVLNRTVDEFLRPHSQRNGENIQTFDQKLFFDVLTSLARDAAERVPMQDQISSLQKELLGRVEKVHVASDDHFALEFRAITALIKTLSRTVRAAGGMNIAEALGAGCLQENVSDHQWAIRARKKLLVEAWVWSVLIDNIFRTPFSIYGNDCAMLGGTWKSMFLTGHVNGWPVPTLLSESWRCTTTESMLTLVDREVITQGKINNVPQKLEPGIIATRDQVKNIIKDGLNRISHEPDLSSVSNIVNKAYSLALQMSLQKSRLQVTYAQVGDKFVAGSMDYVPDPEGDDIDQGVVAFIVNPGLTKWGDVHGKNLDCRYDIVASLVQLEAAPAKDMERKTEHDYNDLLRKCYGVAVPRAEDLKALKRDRESQR